MADADKTMDRGRQATGQSNTSDSASSAAEDLPSVKRADKQLSIDDFQVLSKLGEGGFGTVLLVRKKSSGKLYALKVLVKKNMTKSGDAQRAITESMAMQEVKHPFIVQLHYAFQDKKHVYFVLEFVGGGDLFSHLERGIFPEDWCRIYIAEVALAIAHVHRHDFVYRDLKPENVLVGSDGHLVLADFGLAKKVTARGDGRRLQTLIGTPSLLAPEQFLASDYGNSIDWWALGLLFCEMLMGETLIVDHGEDNLHALIQAFKQQRHLRPFPQWVSREARDLIARLLTVPVDKRMCCGPDGVEELKRHPFFKGLDWDALYRKEIQAPLSPFAATHRGQERSQGQDALRVANREMSVLEDMFAEFRGSEDITVEAGAWSSALCDAAARNDVPALRRLIMEGAPADAPDYDHRTAMHLVASEGHMDALRFLVEEAEADVNAVDRWGGTPLDDAVRAKNEEVVKYLLTKGARKGRRRGEATSGDLCDAAAAGDLAELRRLVDAGVDVNQGDYDKRTALHLAAAEGALEAVKFLIEEAGADVSPVDRWLGTPLDDAHRAGHTEVWSYLESKGAERGKGLASAEGPSGSEGVVGALCDAAANGDKETFQRLLAQHGPDVNQGDYDKRTAIHLAASEGILDMVKFLVEECGADVNPEDRWGGTPLDDAIRSKHKPVVDYLLANGARTGAPKHPSATSAELCTAAAENDVVELKRLVALQADVNQGDYDRRTAIHLAASEGALEAVKFLVEAGADVNPVDRWGGTPLDDAVRTGSTDVAEFLRSKGAAQQADPRAKSLGLDRGMDLCEAAAQGNVTALRVLMAQGVDVNQGDYDRRTAIHLAASEGALDVVKFLVEEAKALINPVDRWGGTPLDDAIRSQHEAVAEYLLSKGGHHRGISSPSSTEESTASTFLQRGAQVGDIQSLGTIREQALSRRNSAEAWAKPLARTGSGNGSERFASAPDLQNRSSPVDIGDAAHRANPIACPLSGRPFVDPVVALDGYSYERDHLVAFFQRHGPRSPLTDRELPSTDVVPNLTLRAIMDQLARRTRHGAGSPDVSMHELAHRGSPQQSASAVNSRRPSPKATEPAHVTPDLRAQRASPIIADSDGANGGTNGAAEDAPLDEASSPPPRGVFSRFRWLSASREKGPKRTVYKF